MLLHGTCKWCSKKSPILHVVHVRGTISGWLCVTADENQPKLLMDCTTLSWCTLSTFTLHVHVYTQLL